MNGAVMPYRDDAGKTSGWSGSASSRDRARRRDANGETATLQTRALQHVTLNGHHGATCAELEWTLGIGHGSVSGALSNLHKTGRLLRVTERRNGQEIYVAPGKADGRALAPYLPNRANRPKPKPKRKTHPRTVHVPGQMALFPLPEETGSPHDC